jgi:hypothetical protein
MITFELAKKLQEAGFPQYHKEIYNPIDCKNGFCVTIATLSELIEACIKDFKEEEFRISFDGEKWEAGFAFWDIDSQMDSFSSYEGSTPEEAVSLLWLGLNKKNE